MVSEKPTMIVGGQARLPRELSSGGTVLQVVIKLDPTKGEVLEISCSPCVPLIDKLLKD